MLKLIENDKKWLKHNLVWTNHNGNTTFNTRPVKLETNNIEVSTIKPKARVY